jgi:DNA-binding response OmpR family regulator
VDDHAVLRQGLGRLIDDQPDMVTCGQAESMADAIRLIAEAKPDVVTVDLTLRDGDGLDLCRQIRERWKDLPILVVSMHDETLYAERALKAGARGYVVKDLSQRVAHERLLRVCFNDYDRELALVAEARRPENGGRFILGIGRLSRERDGRAAEFSMVISDAWQSKGLGTRLMELLFQTARAERIGRLTGSIMAQNLEMIHIIEKLGFKLTRSLTEATVQAEIDL